MSWSDGRDANPPRGKEGRRSDSMAAVFDHIDRVLNKLADDQNFQQDLRVPEVQRALDHWTGAKRLSAEETEALFDEESYAYRTHIIPCLNKLKELQALCKQAALGLPLSHLKERKRSLFPSTDKQASGKEKPAGKRAQAQAATVGKPTDKQAGRKDRTGVEAEPAVKAGQRGSLFRSNLGTVLVRGIVVCLVTVFWFHFHKQGNVNVIHPSGTTVPKHIFKQQRGLEEAAAGGRGSAQAPLSEAGMDAESETAEFDMGDQSGVPAGEGHHQGDEL